MHHLHAAAAHKSVPSYFFNLYRGTYSLYIYYVFTLLCLFLCNKMLLGYCNFYWTTYMTKPCLRTWESLLHVCTLAVTCGRVHSNPCLSVHPLICLPAHPLLAGVAPSYSITPPPISLLLFPCSSHRLMSNAFLANCATSQTVTVRKPGQWSMPLPTSPRCPMKSSTT